MEKSIFPPAWVYWSYFWDPLCFMTPGHPNLVWTRPMFNVWINLDHFQVQPHALWKLNTHSTKYFTKKNILSVKCFYALGILFYILEWCKWCICSHATLGSEWILIWPKLNWTPFRFYTRFAGLLDFDLVLFKNNR